MLEAQWWVHNSGGGTFCHDQAMNSSLAFFLGAGDGHSAALRLLTIQVPSPRRTLHWFEF